MPPAANRDGGPGGEYADFRTPWAANIKTLSRAVREGWNIPPELRQEVVDALAEGMRHAPTAAVRVSAAKALGMLYAQNIKLMGLDDQRDQSELQAKLAALRAALADPATRELFCQEAGRLNPPLVTEQDGGAEVGPLS
jgi:hypothetical protein